MTGRTQSVSCWKHSHCHEESISLIYVHGSTVNYFSDFIHDPERSQEANILGNGYKQELTEAYQSNLNQFLTGK